MKKLILCMLWLFMISPVSQALPAPAAQPQPAPQVWQGTFGVTLDIMPLRKAEQALLYLSNSNHPLSYRYWLADIIRQNNRTLYQVRIDDRRQLRLEINQESGIATLHLPDDPVIYTLSYSQALSHSRDTDRFSGNLLSRGVNQPLL